MSLFILFFFSCYGGMHLYAFLRARSALGFGWTAGVLLAAFMALMTAAPFLIRLFERADYELSARVLSYIAYLWLAMLFLFCCTSLALDLTGLILKIPAWLGARAPFFRAVPSRLSFGISLGAALVICIYGWFDAQNIRVERLMIETPKLPRGTERLKIVQVSDVHLGLIIRCDRLVGMLDKVKEERPDVFVVTGDLVDAQINHLSGLRELLQDIKAPMGKFAVTGNHEFYAGIERAADFIRSAGFTLLRGGAKDIGPIIVAGVDDRTAIQVKEKPPASDHEVLEKLDHTKFILYLKHQPHPDPDAAGLFDLMLSGHTHKGQIWPFTLLVKRAHPLLAGRYDIGKGSIVYTSRGSGTWGPPVRFLSHPEVTVIELVRKGN